jgi:ferredoxin
MDDSRFDALAKALAAGQGSRRRVVAAGLASVALGAMGRHEAAAKKHKHKRKKKKCAKAGQATSKKRKKCCKGLVKDGAGRCAKCDVCASGCRYSAIQDAIDDPGGSATISLCAGTYRGTVTIGRSLSLIGTGDGNGASDTILDGTPVPGDTGGSVVTIPAGCPGCTVTLERLRITGGVAENGGGIFNQGATLTLRNCTVSGNQAGTDNLTGGGGIYNLGGTLTLDASHISDNSTEFQIVITGGGGIYNENDGPTPGMVTLQNGSTVTGNGSFSLEGGGILNAGGTVTLLSGSRVSGNTGTFGGGIENLSTLTLIDSEVSGNTALLGGGIYNAIGITTLLNGSIVTDNSTGTTPGSGGGVYNDHGTVDATGGSITDNTPDDCVDDGGTGCPP